MSSEEYVVEKIIDYNKEENKYLIKWHGYADSENTWEPVEN